MSRSIRVLTLACMIGCAVKASGDSRKLPSARTKPDPAHSPPVAKALLALTKPAGDSDRFSDGWSRLRHVPWGYREDCKDEIDLLSTTKEDVEPELLKLATSGAGVHVRFRAAYVLMNRRCKAVIPVFNKMCESKIDIERYSGILMYQYAIRNKWLPPPG